MTAQPEAEPEALEVPHPPVRVTVTPEWLAEQQEMQRRYQQRGGMETKDATAEDGLVLLNRLRTIDQPSDRGSDKDVLQAYPYNPHPHANKI